MRDIIENARVAWGGSPPEWVDALAQEAARTTMTAAAKRIGYSVSAVSGVLANKYRGDLAAVEGSARGALLGDEVDCPVLGEVRRDRCHAEQKKNHTGTSALRTRLFHACRSGCPHSRLKGVADATG
jgi:hypothetical protein